MMERPLDLLNNIKGKNVIVSFRNPESKPISGKLLAFDIHINIVLEIENKQIFLRGDSILSIS